MSIGTLKFYKNDNNVVEFVAIDLIDLQFLCYQGINKNSAYFEEILDIIEALPNQPITQELHPKNREEYEEIN